jgi:Inorganic pyrophosphatase/exopolyphosphatase
MSNIVITSGKKYIDIDAYAGCIAYATLLRKQGLSAYAVTTAVLNESIPQIIKDISLKLDEYKPNDYDKFIILDVSDPNMFDEIVNIKNIIRVIDHHTAFEDYWAERESNEEIEKAEIEFIGSICTNIYEKFMESNHTELLTKDICKLLTAGILDNTLNLKASITTKRDIDAFNELIRIGNLDELWAKEYFDACEEEILNDLELAIINDIKNARENKNLPDIFGQLAIFNSDKILNQIELIEDVFKKYDNWMINIISLKDGKSYIITDSTKAKITLEKLFNLTFNGDILTLNKFMLRKEIIKKASEL